MISDYPLSDIVDQILTGLENTPEIRNNFQVRHEMSSRNACFNAFPESLQRELQSALTAKGIHQLYTHQALAYQLYQQGENVAVSTGVDSGKSLCYQLPVLNSILEDPENCALLLFPTKALSQDQKLSLADLWQELLRQPTLKQPVTGGIGIYDGDTTAYHRRKIRDRANMLFTNPDMLHVGILPNHPQWTRFIRRLRLVVIDEVHVYRGIFGSHFANVIRRLKRICSHYDASPKFILTSATVSNTRNFIEELIGESVSVVEANGAPAASRKFYLYNPPYIDQELGIRRSALDETIRLAGFIHRTPAQALIFAHTRRLVELMVTYLRSSAAATEESEKTSIYGYRSGYLPEERRRIEKMLRDGEIKLTVATNALELGINIGGLDVVLISGFPGSISATRQQAGRAGRDGRPALVIMVAGSGLMDQYILQNPEYLFDNPPEAALINPDNPFILWHHLQCAVFELPFQQGETFGGLSAEELQEYLQLGTQSGLMYQNQGASYWSSPVYPAQEVSLRSAGGRRFVLQHGAERIGEVDQESACWFTHPRAVYLHNGEKYFVTDLDFKQQTVRMQRRDLPYYTQSKMDSHFDILELEQQETLPYGLKTIGQIKVTTRVTGFKRLKWHTNEVLGHEELELPETELVTQGYWCSFSKAVTELLDEENLWIGDDNNYGPDWPKIRNHIRKRDSFSCQACGCAEQDRAFDVHHIRPLKLFNRLSEANHPENLITLCPKCHRLAEQKVRVQGTLSGVAYVLRGIGPFLVMSDRSDLRVQADMKGQLTDGDPALIVYDSIPGGVGLSSQLYSTHHSYFAEAYQTVLRCSCRDGCPMCVGPSAENGLSAKNAVIRLLGLCVQPDQMQEAYLETGSNIPKYSA